MREPPILTSELTSRLERHIAPSEAEIANSSGSEFARFGKTVARKERGYWPPSAVYGFNKDDVGHFKKILEFFGDIAPVFYLSHAGFNLELGRELNAAGFYMAEWLQTVLYGSPNPEAPQLPAAISIELVTSATAEVAAETAAEGNEWPKEWRESAKDGLRQSISRPGHHLYLARLNGEPAGVADLAKGTNGWSTMGGAAVPQRFRKQGIHTALIQYRLHEAYKSGSPLVVGCANFDSPSFRNQQRLGMRLAYVEATWKKRSSLHFT